MARNGFNGRSPKGPMGKPKNGFKTFKRLFSYINKYSLRLIIVVLCIIISSLSEVYTSYLIKPIIDDYITPLIGQSNPDFTGIILMALYYLAIVFIGGITAYVYNIIMVRISTRVLLDMRNELFTKLEELPIKYYDTHSNGDIMSRFTNDIDAIRQMISNSVPNFISTTITSISIYSIMLFMNWKLTIIITIVLYIIIKVAAKCGEKSGKYFKEQQVYVGRVNGYIEEMMEGIKVVKVFNYEDRANKKFEQVNEDLRESAMFAHIFSGILRPVMANIANITYAIIATLGAMLVLAGTLTPGTLVAFARYIKQFFMPITNLSEQFNSILMALAGAERIFEVLDEDSELDEGYVTLVNVERDANGKIIERNIPTNMWAWKHPHSDKTVTYVELKGDIILDNVSFGYNPKKPVLKNLNIEAKSGQKIAFVGSTGAGKTTITNLINRFYDIDKGTIKYDGINIKKIKKDDLRKSLAMVLQDTHLFTGTIKDNIKFGKLDATDNEVVEAAKLANAHNFIMHLPQGYDTKITSDGANLSQGQRQLLAIARAAISNPPILILDEATSSIDTRTEKLIEKGMDNLMKGRTVFVIAHRLSTVRNADNIIVLEHGEIIESGSHDELINQKGRYYELEQGLLELS